MPTSRPSPPIIRAPSRRDLLGYSAMALPSVLGLRAATAAAAGRTPPDTAVIFVMLGGGASQVETYDPKPDAPAEYRGEFQPIRTSVPGVQFCELLPRQAALMKELTVVRSVHHQEASHIALHMVETGYFLRNVTNALRGEMPAVGSVVARVRGAVELPAYVSLPRAQAYSGPHYLGGQYAAFNVDADPSADAFTVANLTLARGLTADVLHDRAALHRAFDHGRRVADRDGTADAMDDFHRRAWDLVTGDRARAALDLAREADPVRDRYTRTPLGQRLLLARRLAEAGVPFVMVRTFDWDDHQGLPAKMRQRAPMYDAALAALIEDLRDRGLSRDVLVVAMGEFGRTPRVNKDAGRDHWPAVMSVLLAGGTHRPGQVIGASDSRGAAPAQSPYRPQQVLGMMYRHLGIDPGLTFPDFTGRPRHLLEERDPIHEML